MDMLNIPSTPAIAYFKKERERHPYQVLVIDQIEDLYTKKLHHQFTNEVELYLKSNGKSAEDITSFIHNIIFPIRQKLSPTRTILLIDFAVSKLSPEEGMMLIDEFAPAFIDIPDAAMRLNIVKANTLIRSNELRLASDLLLIQIGSILDQQIGVDIIINSAYHEACANYFRAADNPQKFYESMLLYIAYTPLNSIPVDRQQSISFELAVAGLIAEGMFDFGDLLAMPILTALDDSQKWILDFVEAASEGSLSMFEAAMTHSQQQAISAFGTRIDKLYLKMKLSSLVDLAFKLPANDRRLTFDAISAHCQVPSEECERLIMKSMSFGLIRGSIDGIAQQLGIDWVKPRLVDPQRIELIRNRFINWGEAAKQLASQLENSMPGLLAA